MKNRSILFLLLLLPLVNAVSEDFLLSAVQEERDMNRSAEYLVDEQGTLTAEEAFSRKEYFGPLPRESVQIPREGVLWLLLELRNTTGSQRWIIENAMNVERMELFLKEDGVWRSSQASGNLVPFTEREIKTLRPAFEVTVRPGEKRNVLIRVFDYQSASIQLHIEEAEEYRNTYSHRIFLLGIVFGFFAALIVYNLIIFFMNREKVYLIYSLYMTAFFLNQFAQERLFSRYFTPDKPYGFFWFIVFGAATAALGLEFIRRFIGTRTKTPRIDFAMRAVRNLCVLLAVSGFFTSGPVSADILNLLSLLAMGLILGVLIIRTLRRDLLAFVCFLGSLVYLAGTAAEIVVTLVPVRVTPFILNAQLYGALAQVFFLGFALGGKSYQLRKQHSRMQEKFREDLEREVADRTAELEAVNRELAENAVTDALTGLYNRAELSRRASELDTYLQRKTFDGGGYILSAAYLDLDNFKYCNDNYGHGYGDRLLVRAADIFRSNTRGYDLIFRLGGDEFLILMPETEIEEASGIVERIRGCFGSEISGEVSVSIGLSSSRQLKSATVERLIHAADTALLLSKEQGKNRISIC